MQDGVCLIETIIVGHDKGNSLAQKFDLDLDPKVKVEILGRDFCRIYSEIIQKFGRQ